MSKPLRFIHPLHSLLPTEVEGFDSLAELALDLRWTWNHATDEVWRQLDPKLWDLTHNPWVVLQTVSRDQIERLMADAAFRKKVDKLVKVKRTVAESMTWFQQYHSQSSLSGVAYFSMEFMLSEALRFTQAGSAMWPGISLKPPAIWVCRYLA